jgi:hypothetical protein
MLDLPVRSAGRQRLHVSELESHTLRDTPVRVADHCYGCTAGQGSSCGGALDKPIE